MNRRDHWFELLYGSMVACLIPTLQLWWTMPTAWVAASPDVPEALRWSLAVMAVGVFLSGVRDLYAAYDLPLGGWPWKNSESPVPHEHA